MGDDSVKYKVPFSWLVTVISGCFALIVVIVPVVMWLSNVEAKAINTDDSLKRHESVYKQDKDAIIQRLDKLSESNARIEGYLRRPSRREQ